MIEQQRVVVIGAGAAGSSAAAALKRGAPDLDVVVIGGEERVPYNRTTVNKGLLTGAVDEDDVALPDLDGLGVSWRFGQQVRSVDPEAGTIELGDRTRLAADAFVLATGADPRPLPVTIDPAVGDRVLTMRTPTDALRLRAALGRSPAHVVIAGAGLLGSETAGSLRGLGVTVTLVDPADRPLGRHVGLAVSEWVHGKHVGAGVDLRTATGIAGVGEGSDAAAVVTLDDGSAVQADAVVASLGVTPAIGWLRGSVIPLSDGVPVDAEMRVAGCPRFYAAGDLAAVPGPGGVPSRIEHWGAALSQGRRAAASVLADLGRVEHVGAPRIETPSYSTYVHGTKLTIVGWANAAVTETVVHGAVGEQRFTIALVDGERRIVAGIGVGGARVVNRLRDLIARRADIGDVDSALRSAA